MAPPEDFSTACKIPAFAEMTKMDLFRGFPINGAAAQIDAASSDRVAYELLLSECY
jgi:hypothetical protein